SLAVGERRRQHLALEVARLDERLADGHALLDAVAHRLGACAGRAGTAARGGRGEPLTLVVRCLAQCHLSEPHCFLNHDQVPGTIPGAGADTPSVRPSALGGANFIAFFGDPSAAPSLRTNWSGSSSLNARSIS